MQLPSGVECCGSRVRQRERERGREGREREWERGRGEGGQEGGGEGRKRERRGEEYNDVIDVQGTPPSPYLVFYSQVVGVHDCTPHATGTTRPLQSS